MTRAYNTATTQQNSGGAVAGVTAGKNAVINGGFDIWQRGTTGTFAGAVTYPSVDRWFGVCTGTAPTATISQTTADTTGLRYAMRFGRNSGQTNTGQVWVETAIETANAISLAGKTVTYSFYVKAGANAALSLQALIYYGTGSDQSAATAFSTGWTGGGYVTAPVFAITTTMTRYSFTATIPSNATELLIGFTYTPTGTAGANEWYQIEGVQLEVGSVATPFSRAGGTIQGELAACQRYFWAYNVTDSNTQSFNTGLAISSTRAIFPVRYPMVMRTKPSLGASANSNFVVIYGGYSSATATSIGMNNGGAQAFELDISVASGLTTGGAAMVGTTGNASAYLWLSAEL